jgi:hypothetical protein
MTAAITPGEEQALIAATTAGLDGELRDAFARMVALIQGGMAPRDAVQEVIESFAGVMAETLAAAFAVVLGQSIGAAAVMNMQVGAVSLSNRLYAQAQAVSANVAGIVERHARGFHDARRLALDLFEGYTFRAPDAEPLQFNQRNDRLPRYLRQALLSDAGLAGQLDRAFAQIQVDGLKTGALRAAYQQLLDSINGIEKAGGEKLLQKRLEVAFFERMRQFSVRIAQTELHRAYARRQAVELLDDVDVEFVQWRLAASHPITDICDYFAQVNRHGLGPGVYPKRLAPVAPAHPYCKCVLSPRLDLTGRKAREIEGADGAYFRGMDPAEAARVAGSRDKLAEVLGGADPRQVHNARIDPMYRVQTVAETAEVRLAG